MRSFMMIVALTSPMVASSRSGSGSANHGNTSSGHKVHSGTTNPPHHAPATTTNTKVAIHHNGSAANVQHGQGKNAPMHMGNQPKITTLIIQRGDLRFP